MRTLTMTLVTLLALAACTGSPAPTSTAPRAGTRIVSTVPAATTVILQLGAIDTLVGVSKYDIPLLPPEKQNLPAVGDYESMNKELLLQLDPTALIVYASPAKLNSGVLQLARQQNIELLNLRFDRLEDLWNSTRAIGRVTGKAKEAEEKIAQTQGEIARVSRSVTKAIKPRVLYVSSTIGGITVVGGGTFINEIITAAGGQNVAASLGKDYLPNYSREQCQEFKPDVVILALPGEPPEQPGDPRLTPWLTLDTPASHTRRVHLLTDPNALLATLTVGQTARHIAALLHPELTSVDPLEAPAPSTGAPP